MDSPVPRATDLGLSATSAVEFDRSLFGPPDIAPEEIKYLKKIGGGCFGSVWLGECRGIKVAVKKLFKQDLNQKTLDEFKREVEFCSRLNHPNVLLFMGACTQPGNMAIVMEIMERGNLEQLLHNKNAQLSLFRRMIMAKDVALGMNWLHHSDPVIIHRDLKPSNLLVDKHGTIKVCDFGLSAIKPDHGKLKDKDSIPGTPLWMAPEVMLGRPLDEKSDVYSFGIVLWEIVTQKVPFPHMTSFPIFKKAICFENVRPPVGEDEAPASIRNLLQMCWHRNPEMRPSFDEIIQQLDLILVDCAISDPEGQEFWKQNFQGHESVKFDEFIPPFYSLLGVELVKNAPVYECAKLLMSSIYQDNIMQPQQIVKIEAFGRFLDFFGPLRLTNKKGKTVTIFDRMVSICKQPWFHGDISKEDAENFLRQYREGFFLIRLSTTQAGTFTISRVSAEKKIVHHRIEYKPGQGYSTKINTKPPKIAKSTPHQSLRSFLKLIKDDLQLVQAVPGTKFKYVFAQIATKDIGGYDEDNNED